MALGTVMQKGKPDSKKTSEAKVSLVFLPAHLAFCDDIWEDEHIQQKNDHSHRWYPFVSTILELLRAALKGTKRDSNMELVLIGRGQTTLGHTDEYA